MAHLSLQRSAVRRSYPVGKREIGRRPGSIPIGRLEKLRLIPRQKAPEDERVDHHEEAESLARAGAERVPRGVRLEERLDERRVFVHEDADRAREVLLAIAELTSHQVE